MASRRPLVNVSGSVSELPSGDTIPPEILGAQSFNAQTGTTYTLALSDVDKLVTLTNASAITCTVPPNSSVAIPVGKAVDVARMGAGQVTFAPGSGVTLRYTPGAKLRAQYSGATLLKIATDEWLIVGDLSA